jgi:cell shape-determining protein MreC
LGKTLPPDQEERMLIEKTKKYIDKVYKEFNNKILTQEKNYRNSEEDNRKLKLEIKDLGHQLQLLKNEAQNNQMSSSTTAYTFDQSSKIY